MPEERVLDVKNLKIDFHTYAGEVKAIRMTVPKGCVVKTYTPDGIGLGIRRALI